VPFPRVPRGLRLGREQWALPWRFGASPRALHLLHSVMGVAPVFSAVPLALTVPDLAYRIRPEDMHPRARWYFGMLGPRSIRKARRIMVSSQAVSREVIDLYHIAPERMAYVPLAADPIFSPRPSIEVADIRKSFGLPEHYVLYVGTIDPRKDLGRLRAAYELLPPDLTDDSALVFVGRTNRGADRLARELRKAGPRIHVIGLDYVPREMLPAIYSGASIFVYPSRYEGFGLPVDGLGARHAAHDRRELFHPAQPDRRQPARRARNPARVHLPAYPKDRSSCRAGRRFRHRPAYGERGGVDAGDGTAVSLRAGAAAAAECRTEAIESVQR